MRDPGHVAVGTWSGGRFMHFGAELDDERLTKLLTPGDGIDTVLTADTYGAGDADRLLGSALDGDPARGLLPGGRGRPRLLRGRARRAARLPALHRPAPARPRRLRRLPAHGHRGVAGALRRRRLRPAAAAQPRPHRLHVRGGLGRDGRAARRRPDRRHRRGPRARQRLHARRDRLPGALRRPDRLGHGHPEPAGAVAGRVRAARRRARGRARDHPRRGLRRAVLGRPAGRLRVPQGRPPRLPAGRLGGPRAGADRPAAPGGRAPRPDPAAAGLPVEPGPPRGGLLRADADPGDRRARAAGRGQARRAGGHARARSR